MKIKISNKEFIFKDTSNVEERKNLIQEFLDTKLEFATGMMSIEEYFTETWDKPNTKKAMDMIGYYLSKMPDQKRKRDQMVLNKNKMKEMESGVVRTTKKAKELTDEDIEKLKLTEKDLLDGDKLFNVYRASKFTHYANMSQEEKMSLGIVSIEDIDI